MKRRQAKGFGKRAVARIIFIIAVVGCLTVLANQWIEMYAIKLQKEDANQQLHGLLLQQKQLQDEQMLFNQPEYIEKIAREELGMVREGEVPYIPMRVDDSKR